jgi:hypothetical protein
VRHRQRIRARLAVEGKVFSDMKAVVRLATGSDDPVSTNQTLDESFSTKNIGLDMAYFEYKPTQVKGLSVIGGKFKNPFFKPGKSELIWDSDWNPEGGVATFKRSINNFDVTLIGSGLWIEERSKDKDSYLAAGQGVFRYNFNEKKSSIAFGGGYFFYGNVKDFHPFYEADDPCGNSEYTTVDTSVNLIPYTSTDTVVDITITENHYYLNNYKLLELFTEATHKFNNIPVTVMGDYVINTAADSLETGWLVGLRVGKAKKPGSWEFRYIYREVEKDAVVGAFTDSDFRGGGTNAKGHEIGGAYQLAGNTAFKVSYFMNEIGLDQDKLENFERLQVDLQLKF